MNKNILFFAVLGFFSLDTIASEHTTPAEEIIAAVEEVETAAHDVIVAAEAVDVAVAAVEAVAFTPVKFTMSFTITPGSDASTTDFDSAAATMKELIEAGHRGSPSLYQNLLVFIKELQEAIVAGMNLFAVATTSQETVVEMIEDVAVEAVQNGALDTVAQVAQIDLPSKGIVEDATNSLTIAYSIVVDKVENLALWESVRAQMIALADALNMRTKSPAELSSMLETIMHDAQPLHNSMTTLSATTKE